MRGGDRWLLVIAGAFAATAAGCYFGQAEPQVCELDGDCSEDGVPGECVGGYCAYPDDACPSGSSWSSGPDAGQCVPFDDTGEGEDTGADAGGDDDGESEESSTEESGEESETSGFEDLPPPDLPPEPVCEDSITVDGVTYSVRASGMVEGEVLALVADPHTDVRNPRMGALTSDALFVGEYDPELEQLTLVTEVDLDVEGITVDEDTQIDAADLSNDGLLDFGISSPGGSAWYLESDGDAFVVHPLMHPQLGQVGGIAMSGERAFLSTTDPSVSVFGDPPAYLTSQPTPVHSDWWIGSDVPGGFAAAYFASGSELYGALSIVNSVGVYGPLELGGPAMALERSLVANGTFTWANDVVVYARVAGSELENTVAAAPGALLGFAALYEEAADEERLIGQVEGGAWISTVFPDLGTVEVETVVCTADEPIGVESTYSSGAGAIGLVLEPGGVIEVVGRELTCGDGIVTLWNGEECDDGNQEEGDGCDAACTAE